MYPFVIPYQWRYSCTDFDDKLFWLDLNPSYLHRIKANSNQVLQPPDNTNLSYKLRARSHYLTLSNKTKFPNDADFIVLVSIL